MPTNNRRLGGVLTIDGSISKADCSAVKAEWERKYSSVKNCRVIAGQIAGIRLHSPFPGYSAVEYSDGYATCVAYIPREPYRPEPQKYECRTCGGPIQMHEAKCSFCTTATGFVVLR